MLHNFFILYIFGSFTGFLREREKDRVCVCVCVCAGCKRAQYLRGEAGMGWLRLVGSLKVQVSFTEYSLFYRALLQKRPTILRSLLVVATPYDVPWSFYFVGLFCENVRLFFFVGLFCGNIRLFYNIHRIEKRNSLIVFAT